MSKVNIFEHISQELGLTYNHEVSMWIGHLGPYTVSLNSDNKQKEFGLIFNIVHPDAENTIPHLEAATDQIELVSDTTYSGSSTQFLIKADGKKNERPQQVVDTVQAIIAYLQEEGFENVSALSGEVGPTSIYEISGGVYFLNEKDYREITMEQDLEQQALEEENERVMGGVLGAFFGSLIGMVLIIILLMFNRVSFLGGLAMGYCALKGYEILGKKLSVKGMVIAGLMALAMTYFSMDLTYAIKMASSAELGNPSIFEAFEALNYLKSNGMLPDVYNQNMLMLMGFTGVGIVFMIWETYSAHKKQKVNRKLA